MSDVVTLVNRSTRTHVIVLDHEAFRDKRWGFKVTSATAVDTKDGVRHERAVRRALPGAITLFPGARIENLPPAIEKVTQVAALLARTPPEVSIERAEKVQAKPSTPQDDSSRATLAGERRGRKKSEG